MFHPSSNTARTHAHTSISTLKSLVNFCSRDFLFHKEFDDSTLAKRRIVVGHFVRSDTGHVMRAIDVTRHSRITQQLVPSTTALSFQFACKKKVAYDFRYDPRSSLYLNLCILAERTGGQSILNRKAVRSGCYEFLRQQNLDIFNLFPNILTLYNTSKRCFSYLCRVIVLLSISRTCAFTFNFSLHLTL